MVSGKKNAKRTNRFLLIICVVRIAPPYGAQPGGENGRRRKSIALFG